MATDGVTSSNSTTATSSMAATGSTASNQLDAEDFLQILAAELQYQDPTKGVDTGQYITQLAQLTSVEQLESLNDNFSEMMMKQDLMIGSSWIGKKVAVYEGDANVRTGIVEGFVLTDNGVEVYVDGNQYTLDQIVAVSEQEETETESGDETDTESTEETT